MELEFSRHARGRMRRDKITQDVIEEILREPDLELPSEEGRINAWRRYDRGWLSVTYVRERGVVVVVTVIARRRGPRS